MRKLRNLTGQRFGRLSVISRSHNETNGSARWLAKCDCGIEKTIVSYHLLTGHTRSCGCLRKEKRGA